MPRRKSNLGRYTRVVGARRKKLAKLTEQERALLNLRNRLRMAQRRAEETKEQRSVRLAVGRFRAQLSRQSKLIKLKMAEKRYQETANQHRSMLPQSQYKGRLKHSKDQVITPDQITVGRVRSTFSVEQETLLKQYIIDKDKGVSPMQIKVKIKPNNQTAPSESLCEVYVIQEPLGSMVLDTVSVKKEDENCTVEDQVDPLKLDVAVKVECDESHCWDEEHKQL